MKTKTKRLRARTEGKKVVGRLLGDDPGTRRRLAIQGAIEFLVVAVRQERIALARTPNGAATDRHTENVLQDEIGSLPTVDHLRKILERDPVCMTEGEAALSLDVDRWASALTRSFTKAFYKAERETRFLAAHNELSNRTRLPVDTTGLGVEEFLAALDEHQTNVSARRDEIRSVHEEISRVLASAGSGSAVGVAERLRKLERDRNRLLAVLAALDPREPVFRTTTELRAAIAERIGESPRSVVRLEKATGLTRTKS